MSSGFPDWHVATKSDIIAQSLGNLKISIAEQLLDKLRMDIASQSVGNLAMNIAQQDLPEISAGIRTFQAEDAEYVDASDTSVVASYSGLSTVIRAPTGYVLETIGFHLFCLAPTGATTGEHGFTVDIETTGVVLTSGHSLYSDYVEYRAGMWVKATSSSYPTTDTAQLLATRGVRLTDTYGVDLYYENFTDASQDHERIMWAVFRKIKVS